MMLTINGHQHDYPSESTILELLDDLGMADKPVVIELNQRALSPSEFKDHRLKDGDVLEIITIAAGG